MSHTKEEVRKEAILGIEDSLQGMKVEIHKDNFSIKKLRRGCINILDDLEDLEDEDK